MGWADFAIKALQKGKTVTIKPTGNSMRGKVESGSKVIVEPISLDEIEINDIILCKVKGRQYLHLVKAKDKGRVLIGNNKGFINGWTSTVYGKAVKIERPAKKKK
jgi:hypothetical protein